MVRPAAEKAADGLRDRRIQVRRGRAVLPAANVQDVQADHEPIGVYEALRTRSGVGVPASGGAFGNSSPCL